MSQLSRIVKELKKQERRLVAQLAKIRAAISSLEFGGGGVPAPAIIDTPHAAGARTKRVHRKMSAAQTVAKAMKKASTGRRSKK